MTTAKALETYDKVADDIFCRSNKKKSGAAGGSRFKASTLRRAVETIVAQRNEGDLMSDPNRADQKGKAFLCAVLADRLNHVRPLTYEVEDDPEKWLTDCKIWEAARATTAAPIYFKGMDISRDAIMKSFVDAALGWNNPSEELLDEAGRIFHKRRKLGAIQSLGTGTRPNGLARPENVGFIPSV